MDNSEKQQYLNNLERMLLEGVLETEYNGKKVKFRSLSELIQIRNMTRRELGIKKNRRIYTEFSEGL